MFDISKFSASNAQSQSLVKEYELFETYQPTHDDIQVSLWDTFNVVGLTLVFLLPIAACTWWRAGVDLLWVVVVVAGVSGAIGLWRYDKTTRDLFARQRYSSGHVSWERNNSAAKQSQKAEVKYVVENWRGQNEVTDMLKSEILSLPQLEVMAAAVLSEGKFNQDIVCRSAKISASDYNRLSTEMIEQKVIALKGATSKQGYNITKRGYYYLGLLVHERAITPTPLLE